MPNPLDLPGPQFLAFYLVLVIAVNVALRLWSRVRPCDVPPELDDPYLIAHLRGGQAEVIRVAAISLMDRGLLVQTSAEEVATASEEARGLARRPVEIALLDAFRAPGPAWRALAPRFSRDLDMSCDAIAEELKSMGLLKTGATILPDLVAVSLGLGVLLGMSLAKLAVALARGHHNIGFLVVLTLVGCLLVMAPLGARRTRMGDLALARAKEQFASLRARVSTIAPGGATNELSLLAAVFGIGMIPAVTFPYAQQLFPKAQQGDSSGASSGCSGSGCSGGSSSSCGGGGGCGGGCGGCGG